MALGVGGDQEVAQEESAGGGAEADDGDDDYREPFTVGEGGRYGACVGEGGGLAVAGYGGLDSEDFVAADVTGEEIDAGENIPGSGARAQTRCRQHTGTAPNADGSSNIHRSWLDMDRVDPCQPTQSFNVGGTTHGQESVHWSATRSGRDKSVRIDIDEYVEQSECNVDVGLTLQGRFY
jgi:hypothetical protein